MKKIKNTGCLAKEIAARSGDASSKRISEINRIIDIIIDLSADGSVLEESGLGVEQNSALDVLFDATINKHKNVNLQ